MDKGTRVKVAMCGGCVKPSYAITTGMVDGDYYQVRCENCNRLRWVQNFKSGFFDPTKG